MAQLQVLPSNIVRRNTEDKAQCLQFHQRAEDMSGVVYIRREVFRTSYGPRRVLHLQPMSDLAIFKDEIRT